VRDTPLHQFSNNCLTFFLYCCLFGFPFYLIIAGVETVQRSQVLEWIYFPLPFLHYFHFGFGSLPNLVLFFCWFTVLLVVFFFVFDDDFYCFFLFWKSFRIGNGLELWFYVFLWCGLYVCLERFWNTSESSISFTLSIWCVCVCVCVLMASSVWDIAVCLLLKASITFYGT